MITHVEVDGRPGSLAYVDDKFRPVDKAVATLGKIVFDDGGQIIFDARSPKQEKFWDESKHPREPAGSPGGGQFAGGDSEGDTDRIEAPAKVEARAKAGVKAGADLAAKNGLAPLPGSVGEHPATIASRNVTAVRAQKGNYGQPSLTAMKLDPENFAHDVGLFKNSDIYPNFRAKELTGTADDVARKVVDHFKANLRFLYDQAKDRDASKLWYDGARIIVDNRASRYGYNDASVAAVYAALSPQKDWDMNVYLGDELMHIYATRQDHTWDEQMSKTASAIKWSSKYKPLVKEIEGKTLRDLPTSVEKAIWVRVYNEAHSSRFYRAVRPDGTQGGFVYTKQGKLAKAAWQSVTAIANAIKSIEANGDRTKISAAMGDAHKVRSFYNNILDPHSANGDTTIDTHAVGAALLRPLGGGFGPVHQNFGTGPSKEERARMPGGGVSFESASNSAITGNSGTYGLYAQAHRELAKELGLEPRQLQSIVWVAKRNLFDRGLTDKQTTEINAAWQKYHDDPSVTLQQTQTDIARISGGFDKKKDFADYEWLAEDDDGQS